MLQIVQKNIAPSHHRENVDTPQICLESLILARLSHVNTSRMPQTLQLTLESNMEDGIEASGNHHLVSVVARFENVEEENQGSKKVQ